MNFEETLREHLRAIKDRDLQALEATLGERELVLITADGELFTEPSRFVELHRKWFASDTWTLATELVHTKERESLAVAVVKLDYRDDSQGVHEQSLLTLIFEKVGERWVMVQDQNTPVRA